MKLFLSKKKEKRENSVEQILLLGQKCEFAFVSILAYSLLKIEIYEGKLNIKYLTVLIINKLINTQFLVKRMNLSWKRTKSTTWPEYAPLFSTGGPVQHVQIWYWAINIRILKLPQKHHILNAKEFPLILKVITWNGPRTN